MEMKKILEMKAKREDARLKAMALLSKAEKEDRFLSEDEQKSIDAYKGASYYFIHNDTLFIQVDNDSPYNQGDQIVWMDNVITNNPTKFIIVSMHVPVNETGTDYNRSFMDVLEKHGVDLVLAGHYHTENLKILYLDQKPYNDKIGVTYFRGAGGGVKASGDSEPEAFAKGYIIDVLDDAIKIRYINGNGEILTTKTVKNNKVYEKEEATKTELKESIKTEFDPTNQVAKFTWSSKFFKNVKHMSIEEVYRDQRKVEFIFPTPGYTAYTFDKLIPHYNSKYKFVITFADNSKEILEFSYKPETTMGITAKNITSSSVDIEINEPLSSDATILKNYVFYVNGVAKGTFDAKDINTGKTVTSFTLDGLTTNTTYKIVVEAHSRNGLLYIDEIEIKTK